MARTVAAANQSDKLIFNSTLCALAAWRGVILKKRQLPFPVRVFRVVRGFNVFRFPLPALPPLRPGDFLSSKALATEDAYRQPSTGLPSTGLPPPVFFNSLLSQFLLLPLTPIRFQLFSFSAFQHFPLPPPSPCHLQSSIFHLPFFPLCQENILDKNGCETRNTL
jgi:hypothetical protein